MTSLFESTQNQSEPSKPSEKDDLRIRLLRWYLLFAVVILVTASIFASFTQRRLEGEIEVTHLALVQGIAQQFSLPLEPTQSMDISKNWFEIGGINNYAIVLLINAERQFVDLYEFMPDRQDNYIIPEGDARKGWLLSVARQLPENQPAFFMTADPIDREWIHSAAPLAEGGWLVLQRPSRYAFATSTLIYQIIIAAMGVYLLGGMFSWLILSRQVIFPLEQLETFSEIIRWRGQTRPDEAAALHKLKNRPDQIGNLARGLTAMEQEVDNRFVQLSTLLETSRVVAASLDAVQVIDNILNQVEAMFDVPRSAVVALDRRAGTFRIRASQGLSQEYTAKLRIAPSEPNSPSMRALRNQAPIQVANTETDLAFTPFRQRAEEEGYRSVLAIPLQNQHAPPAVLLLYKSEPYRYSFSELELASSFGNLASMALENAALFARTDEQLQEQTRRLEAIVESLDDGLVLESLDGKVMYCNQQTCLWLQIPRSQMGTKTAAALYARLLELAKEPELAAKQYEAAMSGTGAQTFDLEQVLANGRCRDLRIHLFNVTDARGELLGRGQLWQDITKDKELDRMKSALLSTVSHELRTPLATIKGYASTLLAKDVAWGAAAQQEFLTTISEETDRLATLVQNLLDMSRIEVGILQVRGEYYSLNDLCQEIITGFRPPLNGRLHTTFQTKLPLVWMDLSRIGTVIRNYIENGLKYGSEESDIELHTYQKNETVIVSVRDYGPGIPGELHQKVFDRFYRADNSLTQRVGGTGLGLAICKGFVEAHGGKVWLETAVPGTIFNFSLPIHPEKAEQNEQFH
ncbi:MAG: GAF domain-containing protein [Chloroflexi bacterium]|nr:GAF domain-containing protein [Chloroflexota bacterium]